MNDIGVSYNRTHFWCGMVVFIFLNSEAILYNFVYHTFTCLHKDCVNEIFVRMVCEVYLIQLCSRLFETFVQCMMSILNSYMHWLCVYPI